MGGLIEVVWHILASLPHSDVYGISPHWHILLSAMAAHMFIGTAQALLRLPTWVQVQRMTAKSPYLPVYILKRVLASTALDYQKALQFRTLLHFAKLVDRQSQVKVDLRPVRSFETHRAVHAFVPPQVSV